jgi:hypothetical protein
VPKPSRWIVITPDSLQIAIGAKHEIIIRGLEKEAGPTPGLGVMIGLSPTEARRFAVALRNTASKAEEGFPRL